MALNLVSSTVLKTNLNAYLDGEITLQFDQDIDEATVNDTTVILYLLPNYNPWSISRTVDGSKIIIKSFPTTLVRNSSYELLIVSGTNGVKSLSSETISENKTVAFSTLELLAPTDPPADPATVIDQYSNVQQQVGDPAAILVPDVSLQGEIVPFKPCAPGGFSNGDTVLTDSGIPSVITGTTLLKSTDTDPDNYTIGVTDLSTITVFYPEDILISGSPPIVELTYEDLNWPFGAFTKTSVTIDTVVAVGNQLIITTSGLPVDLTNLEFTLVVKALKLQSIDGIRTNGVEKFYWLGALDPLLCTFDMARANAGLWNEEFSQKDIYYYMKMMYIHSVTVLRGSGYANVTEVPTEELSSMAKYVCCSTALDMLTNGGAGSGSGSTGRSGLFVKKRQLPGVTVEYGNYFSAVSGKGQTSTPAQESLKRLLECIDDHKPKDERLIENGGPMAIATGIKSIYDTSLSIPGRRRL